MVERYRFIISPWLMRAAFGAVLVGSMALFPSGPQAAPKSDPKEEYLEQVGAYSKLENAATMVETLRVEGKNAFIRQKTVDGKLVFIVLVEPKLVKKDTKPAPAKPEPKPAPKPEPKKENPKETAKPAQSSPAQSPSPAPKPKPSEPKMETVIVTDTMPPAVPPAPKPEPKPEPKPAPAPAPASSPKPAPAPAPIPAPAPAPAALKKGPVAPPSAVVLPVTRPDATESIEVMSDVYVYDRPFASGKPIGTYAETGGAYVKEYLGWYAIALPNGGSGFIKKEDADIINVTAGPAPAQ